MAYTYTNPLTGKQGTAPSEEWYNENVGLLFPGDPSYTGHKTSENPPPTPLPPPPPKPPVTRYPLGATNTKQKDYYEGLDTTEPTEEEQQATRDTQYSWIQKEIDAINNMYSGMISQEQQRGTERLGESRALAARSGILGVPRGLAQKEKTAAFNTAQVEYIQQEKQQKIATLYGKADERALKQIEFEKNKAIQNQQTYMDYLKDVEKDSRSDVRELAQAGYSLEELRGNKEYYDQLRKETGWSELQFDTIYNNSKKKEDQIDWKYQMIQSDTGQVKIIAYGIDPSTGELTEKEYETKLDIPPKESKQNWHFSMAPNGTPLVWNDSGQVKIAGGFTEGQFAKDEGKKKDVDGILNYTQAWISDTINPMLNLSAVPTELRGDVIKLHDQIIPDIQKTYNLKEKDEENYGDQAFQMILMMIQAGATLEQIYNKDERDWIIEQIQAEIKKQNEI